jgi:hypothetical protein
MISNGASPDEVREFSSAMNRWRVAQFRNVFREAQRRAHIDLVHTNTWSGTVKPEHQTHQNLRSLQSKGYTRDELMVRGLMFVIRKVGASARPV